MQNKGICWKPFLRNSGTGGAGCGRAEYPFQLSLPVGLLPPTPSLLLIRGIRAFVRQVSDDFARLQTGARQARELPVRDRAEGALYFIAMPGGKAISIPPAMPAMAKGGSGDVLTGILTALVSQGYSPGGGVHTGSISPRAWQATWPPTLYRRRACCPPI